MKHMHLLLACMQTVHLLRAREGVLVSGAGASDLSTWELAKHSVRRKGVKVRWMDGTPAAV